MIDKTDGSWLCTCANQGNLKAVKELIEQGVNADALGPMGETALAQASMGGNLDIVQYMVDKGADVNAVHGNGLSPLVLACDCGHMEVVRFLVDHGANLNPSISAPYRQSVLCKSISRGHYRIVSLLIERGADVNASDGETPLEVAIRKSREDIVSILVEHGAIDTSSTLTNDKVSTPVSKPKASTNSVILNFFKGLFGK